MNWLLVVAVLTVGQPPTNDSIRLFLGPVVETELGLIPAPVPKGFEDSYRDIKGAHGKRARLYRRTSSPPPLVLVDELARADLVLMVTHRGQLKEGGSHTLMARLLVRRAGDTVDLSGVPPGRTGRVRWREQAERIYAQAAAFADRHYSALIRMRAIK